MSSRKRIGIQKWDVERCLLTDTVPYELPVILSNKGFHRWARKHKEVELSDIERTLLKVVTLVPFAESLAPRGSDLSSEALIQRTLPYRFRVMETEGRLRELALPHPAAQLWVVELYRHFDGTLCELSRRSEWSIRSIRKVADSFFRPRKYRAFERYKRDEVDTVESAAFAEYSGSYFAYQKYDRPHKFFDSAEFDELEQKYPRLRKVDISRCFPSIYTHTIEWAIIGKDRSKLKVRERRTPTLSRLLDRIAQNSNDGETNGIIVGPEFSRIFSELILQRVDVDAEKNLIKLSHHSSEYCVRRYVDDIYIFSRNEHDEQVIVDALTDALRPYNLTMKPEKNELITRPFFSGYDRAITGISSAIETLFDSLFEGYNPDGISSSRAWKGRLRRGVNPTSISRNFTKQVKASCSAEGMGYDRASGYILSALFRKVADVVIRRPEKLTTNPERAADYEVTLSLFCRISLHMYALCPTAGNSLFLARSVILSYRFLVLVSGSLAVGFADGFMSRALRVMSVKASAIDSRPGYTPIGGINLLLATREFGECFLLPPPALLGAIGKEDANACGYFEIVSLLYYCRNEPIYHGLTAELVERIIAIIEEPGWERRSEAVHLLLDTLSCPFIEVEDRLRIAAAAGLVKETQTHCKRVWRSHLASPKPRDWFVQWTEIDILRDLQRKALSPGY